MTAWLEPDPLVREGDGRERPARARGKAGSAGGLNPSGRKGDGLQPGRDREGEKVGLGRL